MANDAVMREFHHRRLGPSASISLVDCRAVSPAAYFDLASSSRPRMGFTGHAAVPFGYELSETGMSGRGVVKTFWSWKRVAPPKLWREALVDAEDQTGGGKEGSAESRRSSNTAWSGVNAGEGQGGGGVRGMRRRGSWWNGDRDEDDDRGCVVM
jgi:F-box/leucine-rich repeat protein 2/20